MEFYSFFIFILLICSNRCYIVTAVPHPHNGIIQPFNCESSGIHLDQKAQSLLAKGMAYRTHHGWVVQDIEAPNGIVWEQILDYDNYKNKVPNSIDSEVYKEESIGCDNKQIFVRFAAGNSFYKINFFIQAEHIPKSRSLTWKLDYSKRSDVNDSVGCWFVIPHPDYPEAKTRVYYSQKLSLLPWMPAFLQNAINKSATMGGTKWLKRHSEITARKKLYPYNQLSQ